MKKSSLIVYILLTSVISVLWLAGSWWHYACNIKNTCRSTDTIASTPVTPNIDKEIDTDDDGLSDDDEAKLGTDPLLADTDQDSISDSKEVGVNLNSPLDSDEDGFIDALDFDDDNDGISTLAEEKVGTSSLLADTDEDGILDAVEIGKDFNNPLDTDGDGIINALDTDDDDDGIETIQEALLGTNPLLIDTDGDGKSDSEEIGSVSDKPLDENKNGVLDALESGEETDQDNDGLTDSLEAKLNTDPTKADTDGDGINDAIEVGEDTNDPKDIDLDGIIDALDTEDNSDSDNDGLSDSQELKLKSNPQLADSDNDGINDLEELGKNTNEPLDSDNDGVLNIIDSDDDNDNLSTRYEMQIGTNPLTKDSDNDGLLDDIEVKVAGSDALQDTDEDEIINAIDFDDDNDTIPTVQELILGTDPLKTDSDGDGITDAIEVGSDFTIAKDTDGDGIIDALDTKDDPKKDEKTVSLELTGTTIDDSIQSSILYFPYLSTNPVIEKEADKYLDDVAAWMKEDPKNQVNLTGHTDNTGSKQSNLALGIRRVMVIRELLINRGSPMSQIDIMSRGESQPLGHNDTEAGRLKNRRVEIEPRK